MLSSFRYFEGEDPILVVSNPEHIKQITIKEFHKFHSHRVLNIKNDNNSISRIELIEPVRLNSNQTVNSRLI